MKFRIIFILLCLAVAQAVNAAEEPLSVAVAANFARPMEEIGSLFYRQSSIPVEMTIGSTGKLFAQIRYGAPYDIFLAADSRHPELLQIEGKCEQPIVYAKGAVALYSGKNEIMTGKRNWREVLVNSKIVRIAIPNPELAPYGAAAMQALQKTGLLQLVAEKLVYAHSVASSYQYGATGSVDAAFVAMSYVVEDMKKGRAWPVAEAGKAIQKGCVLSNSLHREAAEQFVRFLAEKDAIELLKQYGYE